MSSQYIFPVISESNTGLCLLVGDSSIFRKVIDLIPILFVLILKSFIRKGYYSEVFFFLIFFLSRKVIIPKILAQRVIIPMIFIPKSHYSEFRNNDTSE